MTHMHMKSMYRKGHSVSLQTKLIPFIALIPAGARLFVQSGQSNADINDGRTARRPARLSVDVRADQRCRLRGLFGARLLLHTHVCDALLLLAHL